MMNVPDLMRMPETSGTKSFWKRPEGKFGGVVLLIALIGLLYVGGPIAITAFGYLVTLLGQMIAIGATVAGLALLWVIGSNRRIRTLTKVAFQSSMRWITGIFVELNPIGIMNSYIEDLSKKQSVIDDSITNLNGQAHKCAAAIEANDEKFKKEMSIARAAENRGETIHLKVASRQAERLVNLNEKRLKPLYNQMQAHLALLRKYSEVTQVIRADLKNEVDIQTQQRELIMSSWSAMNAAKAILHGGTDERAMFDQAVEYMADDYCMKIGAIDEFIESSRSIMTSFDLQDDISQEATMKRLEEWTNRADEFLLGTGTPINLQTLKIEEKEYVLR